MWPDIRAVPGLGSGPETPEHYEGVSGLGFALGQKCGSINFQIRCCDRVRARFRVTKAW